MKAIILAAGMGKRLGKYTENLPKGMLRFNGKTLIERQLGVLRSAGINDISIVRGYMPEKINFPGVKYYTNEDFASTNMVETLFRAEKEMDEDFLILYSDIIYENKVIEAAISSAADIGVVADLDYWDYWSARMDEPGKDIESFIVGDDGKITDLGDTNCPVENAKIRYVGIIKVSKKGSEIIKKVYNEQKAEHFNDPAPWFRSKNFKNGYMTSLLKAVIVSGYEVLPIYIKRGWLEFDTVEDYERTNDWVKSGTISRFINLNES
jgi:choline kinase